MKLCATWVTVSLVAPASFSYHPHYSAGYCFSFFALLLLVAVPENGQRTERLVDIAADHLAVQELSSLEMSAPIMQWTIVRVM